MSLIIGAGCLAGGAVLGLLCGAFALSKTAAKTVVVDFDVRAVATIVPFSYYLTPFLAVAAGGVVAFGGDYVGMLRVRGCDCTAGMLG